jgi:arylsulfatase
LDNQEKHDFLYWEFPESGGQQAVRMGKWKGIRKNIDKDSLQIRLYNLESDIQELNDISSQNPEIVKEIEIEIQKLTLNAVNGNVSN